VNNVPVNSLQPTLKNINNKRALERGSGLLLRKFNGRPHLGSR